MEREGIPALCQLLNAEDSQVVQVLLEALTNILKIGQVKVRNPGGLNPYCLKIEECGGEKEDKKSFFCHWYSVWCPVVAYVCT